MGGLGKLAQQCSQNRINVLALPTTGVGFINSKHKEIVKKCIQRANEYNRGPVAIPIVPAKGSELTNEVFGKLMVGDLTLGSSIVSGCRFAWWGGVQNPVEKDLELAGCYAKLLNDLCTVGPLVLVTCMTGGKIETQRVSNYKPSTQSSSAGPSPSPSPPSHPPHSNGSRKSNDCSTALCCASIFSCTPIPVVGGGGDCTCVFFG